MSTDVPTHTKVFQTVAYAAIGVAIVLLIYLSYLMLGPAEVLSVKEPLPVSPTEVESGGVVNLKLDYCKKKEVPSHITIDFIGEAVVPSLTTTRQFPLGCHERVLPISIPQSTPTGDYQIHLIIRYQVNPVREKTYEFDSIKVKVTNNEHKATVEEGNTR